MKLLVRLSYFIPCAALLFGAVSVAHADSVNGSVWELSSTPFTTVPYQTGTAASTGVTPGSGIYSTTPTATFTVSNSVSTDLFSFSSSTDNSLNGFLTAGGDNVSYNGSSNSNKSDGINNDLFQFTGSTTLAVGTYTFGHDDGLLLYLGGTTPGDLAINQPGETSYATTNFNVCAVGSTINGTTCMADAGTYSFTLDYAEVAGPPADLITNLPLTSASPTPEPSSLVLLGTGLVAAAGVVRRRSHV